MKQSLENMKQMVLVQRWLWRLAAGVEPNRTDLSALRNIQPWLPPAPRSIMITAVIRMFIIVPHGVDDLGK